MTRLDDLQRRRTELREGIAASRTTARSGAATIRRDAGAALLALSVSRLVGGGTRLRLLAAVAGGVLAFLAARTAARKLGEP